MHHEPPLDKITDRTEEAATYVGVAERGADGFDCAKGADKADRAIEDRDDGVGCADGIGVNEAGIADGAAKDDLTKGGGAV